jgi:hypothetical protein
MMYGFVNQRCEAVIRIAVGHANNPKQMIETVIDKDNRKLVRLMKFGRRSILMKLLINWLNY